TVTGKVSQINAPLGNLTYLGESNWFGTDTLTITVNDGGALGEGENQSASDTVTIPVWPLNDAPDVTSSGGPVTIKSNDPTAVSDFSISDIDIDGDGGVEVGEADFFEVTIRLLDSNGDPLAEAAYAGIAISSS